MALRSLREADLDRFLVEHDQGLVTFLEPTLTEEADLAKGTLRGKNWNENNRVYQPGCLGANGRILDLASRYRRRKLDEWVAANWLLCQDVDSKWFAIFGKPAGEYAKIPGISPDVTWATLKKLLGNAGGDPDIHRHNNRDGTMRASINPRIQAIAGTTNADAAAYAHQIVDHSAGYIFASLAKGWRREWLRYGTALEHFATGYDVGVAAGDDELKGKCYWYAANAIWTLFSDANRQTYRDANGEAIHDYNFGDYRQAPNGDWVQAFPSGHFPDGYAEWYASTVVRGVFLIALMALKANDVPLFRKCREVILILTRWTDPIRQAEMPLAKGDADGSWRFHNGRFYGLRITGDKDRYQVREGEAPATREQFESMAPSDTLIIPGGPDDGTMCFRATDTYFDAKYTSPGNTVHDRLQGGGGEVGQFHIPPFEGTNPHRLSDAAFCRWIAKVSLRARMHVAPDVDGELLATYPLQADDAYMMKLITATCAGSRYSYARVFQVDEFESGEVWASKYRTARLEREGCWALNAGDLFARFVLGTPEDAAERTVADMAVA